MGGLPRKELVGLWQCQSDLVQLDHFVRVIIGFVRTLLLLGDLADEVEEVAGGMGLEVVVDQVLVVDLVVLVALIELKPFVHEEHLRYLH